MDHDTTNPIPVLAGENACQIVHSAALAAAPGNGWFFRPGEGDEPLKGPFASFRLAAEGLQDEVGLPDYTSFEFGAGTDTQGFERTLPSDYVHTGSEILIPTILGVERLEEPRRWLRERGIAHRETPSHYRVSDLFPDDDDDEIDEDEDVPSSPAP